MPKINTTRQRSLNVWKDVDAVADLLKFAWNWFLKSEGLTIMECPIGGLKIPVRTGIEDHNLIVAYKVPR